jgi:hypothetical protein
MSVETAFETLRRVNPVPDPAAFRAQLEAGRGSRVQTPEEGRMTDQTPSRPTGGNTVLDNGTDTGIRRRVPPTPPPTPRRRGWALGMAAAVVAVLVLGTMLFLAGREPLGPAAPEDTEAARIAAAVEAAEAYLEASASGDVELATSLVAAEFRTNDVPSAFRDLATLEWGFRLHEAYGFEYRDLHCAPQSLSPRLFVRCEAIWSNAVERRTPADRPEAVAFVVSFDDAGLILSVNQAAPTQDPASEITDQDVLDWQDEFGGHWDEWIAFIERVDPDYFALEDRALSEELGPEEAAEFFEKLAVYLDLYEAHAAEAYEAWLRSRAEG